MTQNTRRKTQDSRLKTENSKLKAVLRLVSCFLYLASFSLLFVLPSLAQTYQEDTQAEPEVYHESALRRFEIVFTISLPFTALHSYLAVRGVGMLRQRKISPELHGADWNAVGGLTILFSGFVAFWDYLHTRGEDISETMLDSGKAGEPESRSSGSPAFWLSGFPASSIQYSELRLLSIGF